MRVAVVQAGSVAFDTPATMKRLETLARDAAQAGAKLAVFPEAFVGGYPKGLDFGARVGSRSDEGRDWFARYFAGAIDLPGPEFEALQALAAELALALVVGVIERDGGTLYCTALFIDETGRYLGKRRKLMPTAMERLIWGMGDGSTTSIVEIGGRKVSAAICWENYMPMLRQWFYAQGAEIHCAPTVDDRDQWQWAMRHIAYEGRSFVLSACQFARRGDYPADYPLDTERQADEALIRGGSVIVSPFGEVLAGPLYGKDGILVADLDFKEIARGKFDLDVAGHYARPDVFALNVDTFARSTARKSEGCDR
ncbi:MAG: carbon-nitrogen hydrolase family protein [Alphaproteobacteria bacterium]